jgi:hypothetical protein
VGARLASDRQPFRRPFNGYRYLVSRIGFSALRHIALMPAERSCERVIGLARAHAEANRLETAACFGPDDAVYVGTDGRATTTGPTPSGLLVVERLRLAESLIATDELVARRASCSLFAEGLVNGGYMVGDGVEAGELASPAELRRLTGRGGDGLPRGLRPCPDCGEPVGDYLRGGTEFVRCWCACENHNRCASCSQPLADHRLSGWFYDTEDGQAWYLAAYAAFNHRCPDEPARAHSLFLAGLSGCRPASSGSV